MKLFRQTTIHIDGFEGNEIKCISYFIMFENFESIKDDEPITQDIVREEMDEVFGSYSKFENLGDITEAEYNVLIKFGMF